MKKKISLIIGIILCTLLISLFYNYPAKYIYRVMVWQGADYDDFKKFKSVEIKKGKRSFNFYKGTRKQYEEVNLIFEKDKSIIGFEEFLLKSKTRSFLVIRNDTLIYEKYLMGNDKESLQTSFSVSKSVLSLLVGIAIQQQQINSVEDPITQYIPELLTRDQKFKHIKISDLLKMRSGLKYSHKTAFPFINQDDPKTYYFPDLRKIALYYTEIYHEPGKKFLYNNYNALLIGLILERATKKTVSTYLQKNIWKKIGSEYDASWSIDDHKFEKMESGFNARPIDFAKIGKLVLNKGNWEGEQLISEEWINSSAQPAKARTYGNPRRWKYNYFWWSVPEKDQESDIMAIGNFGQIIYLSPSSNIIIVRNGEEAIGIDDDDWTTLFYKFCKHYEQ